MRAGEAVLVVVCAVHSACMVEGAENIHPATNGYIKGQVTL